ncbi:ABC transporter substrate-binding protein [Clostridium sp. JNZ J1-5]
MKFINFDKRFFYGILITSLIFLYGCGKKIETIKVGVIGTMSGINSDLSVSGRRGVELAVDHINKAGGVNGRKVELVFKDDKNDSKTSLNKYKEFIDEKVPVVIGPYTSGMIVDAIDYLRNKDILILGPTISADSLDHIDDNFIRFIATTKEQAIILTDMAKKNNNKKFAVIYDLENKGFNESLYSNFNKLLQANKGEIVLTKAFTSNGRVDYADLARVVLKSKADALFIISNSADNAAITQQIRKIGCKVQIYSPLWSNTDDLIKKGGTAIDGMFIVGGMDINDKSLDFVTFKENYIDKYGENPTFASMYSYETAIALFQAMKMGPDLKPSTIKNNIIKIKNFKGLQGNYEINNFGDNIRKYLIFRLENGQPRKVD